MNFFGKNNELTHKLNWLVDVIAPFMARLVLTDGDTTRFSIPDSLVNKRAGDPTMRLENMGISIFND